VCWRRWTGIEPAGRGSLVPTALKAAESTRYPDTSVHEARGWIDHEGAAEEPVGYARPMKRLILLVVVVALAVLAAQKVAKS